MMKRWLGLWAVVGGLLGGCTIDATIDLGIYDFDLAGSWTVDGQPATSALCTEAGIDRVKLVATSTTPAALPVPVLDFSCSAGGFFTTGYPLYYGTYNFQWQAYDVDPTTNVETLIYIADLDPLVVGSPTFMATVATFDIPLPEVEGFSVAGSWTFDDRVATAADCASIGATTVRLVSTSASNPAALPALSFPCSAGGFEDSTILPYGRYGLAWEALDSTGAVIATQDVPVLIESPVDVADLPPFELAVPSSMLINLSYDTTSGPTMTDALCEMTDVNKIYYRFWKQTAEGVYDPAAEVIANELAGAGFDCTNSLFFAPLDDGFYSLYIEADDAGGNKIWNATANDMELFTGEMTFYNVALSQ
jgi:hypothetical protein